MSALRNRASLAAAVGILFSAPAKAQDDGPAPPPVPPGLIDQAGPLPGERIQVDAGTGDGSASISLELLRRANDERGTREAGVVRYSTDSFNLILSTPWNGDDDAQPATLDGLANGTKLTFRWARYVGFLQRNRTPEMRSLEADARRACRAAAVKAHQDQVSTIDTTIVDDDDPGARVRRRQMLDAERDRSLDACAFPPGGNGNLVNTHLGARSQAYIAMLRPRGSYDFGLEASIGRNGFEFVDPATLAPLTDTKVQWSARAHFNYYPLGSRTAFTIAASYERAYEPADEAVFCPPNPNNLVVRCTTAAGGPPEMNESLLLSAGLRHRFAGGVLANFAVAPVVTYDLLDDVVGVDLPIYFIPNSDGGLTGGVRFGYRSDRDDEFSVGVFIGAAFNILN